MVTNSEEIVQSVMLLLLFLIDFNEFVRLVIGATIIVAGRGKKASHVETHQGKLNGIDEFGVG